LVSFALAVTKVSFFTAAGKGNRAKQNRFFEIGNHKPIHFSGGLKPDSGIPNRKAPSFGGQGIGELENMYKK
jgi:hypothetical protein